MPFTRRDLSKYGDVKTHNSGARTRPIFILPNISFRLEKSTHGRTPDLFAGLLRASPSGPPLRDAGSEEKMQQMRPQFMQKSFNIFIGPVEQLKRPTPQSLNLRVRASGEPDGGPSGNDCVAPRTPRSHPRSFALDKSSRDEHPLRMLRHPRDEGERESCAFGTCAHERPRPSKAPRSAHQAAQLCLLSRQLSLALSHSYSLPFSLYLPFPLCLFPPFPSYTDVSE